MRFLLLIWLGNGLYTLKELPNGFVYKRARLNVILVSCNCRHHWQRRDILPHILPLAERFFNFFFILFFLWRRWISLNFAFTIKTSKRLLKLTYYFSIYVNTGGGKGTHVSVCCSLVLAIVPRVYFVPDNLFTLYLSTGTRTHTYISLNMCIDEGVIQYQRKRIPMLQPSDTIHNFLLFSLIIY